MNVISWTRGITEYSWTRNIFLKIITFHPLDSFLEQTAIWFPVKDFCNTIFLSYFFLFLFFFKVKSKIESVFLALNLKESQSIRKKKIARASIHYYIKTRNLVKPRDMFFLFDTILDLQPTTKSMMTESVLRKENKVTCLR